MSLLDLLVTNTVAVPAWRGTWARLWAKPSIFSAQSYIVGLAVLDEQGLCDFRFITDTTKFECIYGPTGRVIAEQMIAHARQALGAARENHAPITATVLPPGIRLDPVGFIAGPTPAHALEEALNEAEIPMEPRPDEARAPRFKSRPAEDVMRAVMDAVRTKLHLAANEVLREDYFGEEKHQARVNLVRSNAAGLIVSGWYADPMRVQLSVLQAAATVETYSLNCNKKGQGGVFLLRPTELSGLRRQQSLDIENALDQVEWQLGKKGLRVAVQEFEGDLASDVAEWAEAAA